MCPQGGVSKGYCGSRQTQGTGFGLQDRTPEISQSEGLVVDFSVIRGEVDSSSLILSLAGRKPFL